MNTYLLFKSLHLIAVISWMAGLLYLPRIFVYHSQNNAQPIISEVFKVMEKKLFYGIATPGGLLTIIFGFCLLISNGVDSYSGQSWFSIKMILIFILVIYHIYCFFLLNDFKYNKNRHTHIWYRWFNEVPVLILVGVVFLAVIKPF